MRKRKPTNHDDDQLYSAQEVREHRMRSVLRAAAAFEEESLSRALSAIGPHELHGEIGYPVTEESINSHPLMAEFYPLHLEVRVMGKSNPLPIPSEKPLPSLKNMVFEFPDTILHQRCIQPQVYHPDLWPQGAAVIFPYNGDGLILHNRPDLAKGPALVTRRLPNGCVLQIHYFQPFIEDVAEVCRACFAEEGSELMDLIESNWDFRETCWENWKEREPPRGW